MSGQFCDVFFYHHPSPSHGSVAFYLKGLPDTSWPERELRIVMTGQFFNIIERMANCKRWQVDGLVEDFVAGIKLHPAGLPVQIRHMVTHWEGGIFGGSIELRLDYLFKSSFRSCNRSYQWHGIAEDKDRKYRSTNILFSVKNIDCSLFVAADGSEQIFWLSTAQMNTLSKISQ